MIGFDLKRMKGIVRNFQRKRVLVLGDVMLDKYIWGNVSRISPEAPVPVVEVIKSTFCLGGAGNVHHNLESLGASSLLVGVVGEDAEGRWIKKHVAECRGIFTVERRPTTVKTRIIAHHQQVVRVDQEKKKPIPAGVEDKILHFLQKENYEGIIISDYNKGIVTKSLMSRTLTYAKEQRVSVFVDPKVENFSFFSPVTLITPNHFEAEKIVHHPCQRESEIERAGREILSKIEALYLIIKRGEEGMSIFEKKRKPVHIPTIAREVFDVTGAGDTVIATAALSLLAGATIHEAAVLSNAAAGIVVGKIGTATVTPEELIEQMGMVPGRF